jgi:hypothetical protein
MKPRPQKKGRPSSFKTYAYDQIALSIKLVMSGKWLDFASAFGALGRIRGQTEILLLVQQAVAIKSSILSAVWHASG